MNLEDLALKQQVTEDRSLRNEGRIKKLETENKVLQDLATSVAVMAEQIKTMAGSVQTLTGKVEHLEEKPAKRWDNIVTQIVTLVVAAAVGFVLAEFGF